MINWYTLKKIPPWTHETKNWKTNDKFRKVKGHGFSSTQYFKLHHYSEFATNRVIWIILPGSTSIVFLEKLTSTFSEVSQICKMNHLTKRNRMWIYSVANHRGMTQRQSKQMVRSSSSATHWECLIDNFRTKVSIEVIVRIRSSCLDRSLRDAGCMKMRSFADIEEDTIEFSLCFMQIEISQRNVEWHLLGKSFFFFFFFSLQVNSKNFNNSCQIYQERKIYLKEEEIKNSNPILSISKIQTPKIWE